MRVMKQRQEIKFALDLCPKSQSRATNSKSSLKHKGQSEKIEFPFRTYASDTVLV